MGIRGTKSAASLATVLPDVSERRLQPPANMPETCKAIWRELVDSHPGSRFHRSDSVLLALYCRALVEAQRAFEELQRVAESTAAEDVERKPGERRLLRGPSPWLKAAAESSKTAALLASKLRLCPMARTDPKSIGPKTRRDHSEATPWSEDQEVEADSQ